jgi:hypothetical protein
MVSKAERRRFSYAKYALIDPCAGHQRRKRRPLVCRARPNPELNRFVVGESWIIPIEGYFPPDGRPTVMVVSEIDRERGIVTFTSAD